MKILFTRFPLQSAYGGAEAQTLLLAEGLRRHGHIASFLGSCPTLCEEMTNHQFPITNLDIGPPPVTKRGAASFIWRKRRMRQKLIESLQATSDKRQAIFMLSLSEKLLVTDWCVERGMKVFWMEHDRIGRWLTWNPWLPRLRRLSRLATTVVVSDLSREIYLTLGWKPENIVSIPNGIDVEMFARGAGETPARPHGRDAHATQFRLGCVARLTRDKGVDLLIRVVAGLPNVTLTIVGTGPEERRIRRMISKKSRMKNQELRIRNQELGISLLPTTDPHTFCRTIDALVLPSREHDPFGLVVAEAMASGVPAICTDACGIAAHLNPEDALIVEAGNVSALRDAIVEVQKPDTWNALAERGPTVARERFSVERMVERYIDLL